MTITHQPYPAHAIDHLDSIYQSVEALIGSIDEVDGAIAVALQFEDECPDCFRQAILHVIELLPNDSTISGAAHLARQWHMECLQGGSLSRSAIQRLGSR